MNNREKAVVLAAKGLPKILDVVLFLKILHNLFFQFNIYYLIITTALLSASILQGYCSKKAKEALSYVRN